MNKVKLQDFYLPISILFVSVFSVISYIQINTEFAVANTALWWIIQIIILYLFFKGKKFFFNPSQKKAFFCIKIYLLWNILNVIRGFYIAETYWDWKMLIGNGIAMLLPIVAYLGSNTLILQSILRFYLRYGLLIFGFLVFLIPKDAYGFYLVPINFLALFYPIIRKPWKYLILGICIFVILVDFGARSNVIKFGVPIMFGLIYFFRFIFSKFFFEIIRKLFFLLPIILFTLAVSGVFNVFKMDDYIKGSYVEIKKDEKGNVINDNLKVDTRTFLYVEVLQTALKYNSWLIGRSPARGNISEAFGDQDMNGRGERGTNEVAILNIFTWTGILGVILYFFVFYKSSYIAINQSNNIFSKILGLFIAFRWLYAWVEDVNNFTLTNLFLWTIIGLCFSKSFRSMSNKEVSQWVNGIFDRKVKIKKRKKIIINY